MIAAMGASIFGYRKANFLILPDCRYRSAGYPAIGILVILLLTNKGDARMTASPKTRQVHRQRATPPPQAPRGAKPIVLPMTRPRYDAIRHNAARVREFLAPWLQAAP